MRPHHLQRFLRGTLVAIFLAVALGIPPAGRDALAQLPGAPETAAEADPLEPEQIQARSEALAADLARAESRLEGVRDSDERRALESQRDGLREVHGLLREQALLAQQAAPGEAGEETAAAEAPLPPPSAFALAELQAVQAATARGVEEREEAVAAVRAAVADAKARTEAADRARRDLRTRLADAAPREAPAIEAEFRRAELESRIARERLNLRLLELHQAERLRDEPAGTDALDAAIARMRKQLARGEGDLRAGLARLAQQEGELRRRHEAVERRLSTAELRLETLKRRYAASTDPGPSALEEVEAATAQRDAIRQEGTLIEAQLERLAEQTTLWRRWDEVLRGAASRADREIYAQEGAARSESLTRVRSQREGRVVDLERRLSLLRKRLASYAGPAHVRDALAQQEQTLVGLLEAQREDLAAVDAELVLTERFLEEFGRGGDLWRWLERARVSVAGLWTYEITSVDDEPLTVGALLLGLILFAAGFWLSRRIATGAGRAAGQRFGLDSGASHAVQSIAFYALWVSFTVLALRIVHFPLTAFTVLGGALAIGVGFGSQNVMNNFISGLILMLERPIRADDLVEVEGNHGIVEHIGARSTRIRSTDGRHIIVPNSFFLENNVVNWTLSDDLLRSSVKVGIVYGAPTRLAEQLIQRVVSEDPDILPKPPHEIVFDDFGDNSLNFEVYFWARVRSPMAARRIKSRMRFKLDDLFREHGIVIAFPQRDVHLDSLKPIEVRVLGEGPDAD